MNKFEDRYLSYCLQADLQGALRFIRQTRQTDHDSFQSLKTRFYSRFIDKNESSRIKSKDPFVRDVISSYRNYWRDALLAPKNITKLNRELSTKLKRILLEIGVKKSSLSSDAKIEKIICGELHKRGLFSLLGNVTPLRSLIIWKKQTAKDYDVILPEQKIKVQVQFLDGFLELGWLHYATFGKLHVGGWAKKNALYCVKKAYRVDGPTFKVHYLAHEAQHFADYKSFPKLEQSDLEYRAKLAELCLTRYPKRFIDKLKAEAKKDPAIPHSFAAHKILQDLRKSPTQKPRQQIAKELLISNSRELKNR